MAGEAIFAMRSRCLARKRAIAGQRPMMGSELRFDVEADIAIPAEYLGACTRNRRHVLEPVNETQQASAVILEKHLGAGVQEQFGVGIKEQRIQQHVVPAAQPLGFSPPPRRPRPKRCGCP